MVRKPSFRVEVDGTDYTSRFAPLVKSIEVSDESGVTSDSASILLADVDGKIRLPQKGSRMRIFLGDSASGVGLAFSGFVNEIESQGSKGGGRELRIEASGTDPNSTAHAAQGRHADDASFEDVAKKFATGAGIGSVVVAPELAQIQRPYWSMQFESFMHWGQRISREIGATFKMQDGKAIFVVTNSGKSASGVELATVRGTVGDNLLNWRIRPVTARPRHGKVRARYFDERKSRWEEHEVDVEPDSPAVFTDRFTSGSAEQAESRAAALKARAERNGGEGSVTILGTANAKPEAPFILSGTRAGIDGTYRIESVRHRLDKGSGFTTSLELRQPSGEAGKDARKASPNAGSPQTAATSPTPTGRAAGPM